MKVKVLKSFVGKVNGKKVNLDAGFDGLTEVPDDSVEKLVALGIVEGVVKSSPKPKKKPAKKTKKTVKKES